MVTEASPSSFERQSLAAAVEPEIVLDARNLSKRYRQKKYVFEAVSGVSLALRAGEILAFLGPNGAGKTTTIKMIAGLVRPDEGQVRILGEDPHRTPMALKRVGAVLEGNRNTYWRLTAQENLEYFGVLKGMPGREARRRGRELLARFDLGEKQHTPVQQLSRGMQQKLAIAVALIHQPQLLLLDEPTLGLDVEAGEAVKDLVRSIAADGCAILLTTHQLDVAEELSNRVAIMRQGRLIAEKPTQELIREFSGSAYRIKFEGELDERQRVAIAALNGSLEGSQIHIACSADDLYRLFDALRPCPILEVQRDQADLTQVFLRLVRGEG
ncbi:MAG: ABC transporter ATP-binding protein [Cyanobacteria bacterium Co-bin8]|nr:ABC transporter ATP-binding protein [Cyanobacteria bacterium Co-bin8]